MHDPELVFLDEPTGGVDPATRRRFWEYIYQAAGRGVTIFVTTHYMDEAAYCDRVSIMVDGAIRALDTPEGSSAAMGRLTWMRCSAIWHAAPTERNKETVREEASE